MAGNKNISLWHVCAFSLALVLVLLMFTASATKLSAQSADDDMEREAQAIDKMIMCPVCPAETIDQAQVEISFQMRAVIREMLAEGKTREEILDYFVDRYGPDILAAPPKSGVNLLAWILPVVGVAAGLAGLFLVIRSMTGRQRAASAPGPAPSVPGSAEWPARQVDDPELAPYLEITDRILSSRRTASGQVNAPGPAPVGPAAPLSRQVPDQQVPDEQVPDDPAQRPPPTGGTHG